MPFVMDTSIAAVPLSGGRFAIVDAADFDYVSRRKWRTIGNFNTKYAVANNTKSGQSGLMHRLIIGARVGQTVDHKNRNGLDNRRSNLRFATPTQNNGNCVVRRHSKTGVKGVRQTTWNGNLKFASRITIGGVCRHLGCFDSVDDAKSAYARAAKEAFGDFAHSDGGA